MTRTAIRKTALLVLALLFTATTVACGQWRMVNTDTRVRQQARTGDYERALTTLQASKHRGYKAQDAVLYWLNEGMLLHLVGRHRESIAAFNRAEARSKQLFTRSISKHVKAAFTSNAALDYQGEDHEKVLINVMKSLSFLSLGDAQGALVEARKINRKLEYLNTVYREHKNAYSEDPFAHWLMGMLFELEGSHDDARIAFANARRVYVDHFGKRYRMAMPAFVVEDLARAAARTGEAELLDSLRTESGNPRLGHTGDLTRTHGEVVVIHLNGEGPTKDDFSVQCRFQGQIPIGCNYRPGGGYMVASSMPKPRNGQSTVTVAFPRVVTSKPAFKRITLSAGGLETTSELALPIDRIAQETLRDKLPRIFRSAVIRAVTKASSRKAANRAGNRLKQRGKTGSVLGFALKLGTDTATSWTEEADKRAWSTLPARIEVARLWLPTGSHEVTLSLPNGKTRTISNVRIAPGQRVFLTHRTIP